MVLFITLYKVVVTFKSVNETQQRDHSNKNYWIVLCIVKGAFVWDQSGMRTIGIMQLSVPLGAILIPKYLDCIPIILLPRAE